MSGYAVARIDEIDEISDGRCPWRPVRFHFGITSFGVNAFTAHQVGDRLINEHDESQEHDLQEELYLVQRGRATFELDGERVDAPAGTLVFVPPEVKRTAFAEEPGTTLVALGGTPGKAYQPQGGEIWMPLDHLYESGQYAEAADRDARRSKPIPSIQGRSTTSRAARASPDGQTTRSSTSGSRSTATSRSVRLLPRTPTSTRSATSPRSRSWFRVAQQSRQRASGPAGFRRQMDLPGARSLSRGSGSDALRALPLRRRLTGQPADPRAARVRRRHHDDAVRLVAPRRLSRRSLRRHLRTLAQASVTWLAAGGLRGRPLRRCSRPGR